MSTHWETADVLKAPMEICWQFDYEIEKVKNLYAKGKQAQWDAEQDLDWSTPIDPSRPLIDESRVGLSQLDFFKALPKKNCEAFRAHMTAYPHSSCTASREP